MAKDKKKSSLKSKLLWLLAILITFALIRQAGMLLLIGMMPTLVLKFIDTTDDKLWFKTVFCFNLSGVYPYIIEIAMVHNNSMKALQAQMADSIMWLVVYGSAAVGYLAMWFFPVVTEFSTRILNNGKIKRHRKKLIALNKEWGVGDPEVELD